MGLFIAMPIDITIRASSCVQTLTHCYSGFVAMDLVQFNGEHQTHEHSSNSQLHQSDKLMTEHELYSFPIRIDIQNISSAPPIREAFASFPSIEDAYTFTCCIICILWFCYLFKDHQRRKPLVLLVCVSITCCLSSDLILTAGEANNCALSRSLHTVKCWGGNAAGRLGYGDTNVRGNDVNEMGDNLSEVDLGMNVTVLEIASGWNHVCAVLDNRKAKCFGDNANGQLGYGTTDDRGDQEGEMGDALPEIDLGTNFSVIQIVGGYLHTCALSEFNKVKCWGYNANGRLGYGDKIQRGDQGGEMGDALPEIDLGTNFTPIKIGAGVAHTCALSRTNAVKCWGWNGNAQLGSGSTNDIGDNSWEMGNNLLPINFGTNFTVRDLEVGHSHNCVISDTDTAKCWGLNAHGQLGHGDTSKRGNGDHMGDKLPEIDLGVNFKVMKMATGHYHTCAISYSFSAKCFGRNGLGQLGVGDVVSRGNSPGEMGKNLTEIDLGPNFNVVQMVVGSQHTCAVSEFNSVKCFGSNGQGQLGYGDAISRGSSLGDMGESLPEVDIGVGFATRSPTQSPTNAPTFLTLSPSNAPTSTPSNAPTSAPTHTTAAPSSSPSAPPSTAPSSAPSTGPPTSPPTLTPTSTPTSPPSLAPTGAPTSTPTFAPSSAPSQSPNRCVDYLNYSSFDGTDRVMNYSYPITPFTPDFNVSIQKFISTDTEYSFFDETVECNASDVDLCLIGCLSSGGCGLATIKATRHIDIDEIRVICNARKSCSSLRVNITETMVDRLHILCIEQLSCDGMEVMIGAFSDIEISVECYTLFSCKDTTIHLVHYADAVNHAINLNMTCYEAHSCDYVMINTDNSPHTFIELHALKHSEHIQILDYFWRNVDVRCGFGADRRYIRYETYNLLDPFEVLDLARAEYDTRRLPCEDIRIDCTNNTDFDRHCQYQYELYNVSLMDMLKAEERPTCYWVDIGYLYHAECVGTCDSQMIYSEYNQSFDLNIIFESNTTVNVSNVTQSFRICDEYFGSINASDESLSSVDAVFYDVLNLMSAKVMKGSIIHNILVPPQTILRDELLQIECKNERQNSINITTNVTIEAHARKEVIDNIFKSNSRFINESQALLQEFFGFPIRIITNINPPHHDKFGGFSIKVIVFIVLCAVCIIGCILFLIYVRNKMQKAKMNALTTYIRNPMVLFIGIAQYDDPPINPQVDGFFRSLDGIDVDARNVNHLFGDQ
eukprot:34471_1